jgi:hypothetical protein
MDLFDKNNQWKFTKIAEQRKNRAALEGEDALIAEMMSWHPEFDEFWPLEEFSAQPREIGGTKVNPFVHTALHVIIEQQIVQKRPLAIGEVFQKMIAQGMDRHKVSHQIGTIYSKPYFNSFRLGQPFDEYSYIFEVQSLVGPPEGPEDL